METNRLFKVKSCSIAARIIAYVLFIVPIAYLAMAMSFIAIAMKQFDYRFIAISQSEGEVAIQILIWLLSALAAASCVYAAKVTWVCFTRFRDTKTFYAFKRATRESRKEMELSKTPNFDDFLEALGDKSPKPQKSILRYVNDLLPW